MVLFAFGLAVPAFWDVSAVTIALAVLCSVPFIAALVGLLTGRLRISTSWTNLLVWAFVIDFVLYVSEFAWAGNDVTWTSLLNLLVFSLPLAGIYAMSASGLVVVYTTTGVFNFAQGAIGMFFAYIDWELTVDRGVPQAIALPLCVLVLAPLFGILLDRTIMRQLQGKQLVVQLMVTVGLM